MKKKKIAVWIVVIMVLIALSKLVYQNYKISRHYPNSVDYLRGELTDIEELVVMNNRQIDLRSYDLSGVDYNIKSDIIEKITFDTNTVWPQQWLCNFSPNNIMNKGKKPGLHIKDLHNQGIDGSGVSVAIIDQPLLVSHTEYSKNIRHYEDERLFILDNTAQMHGPAVTSLLVGETIGVAPKASVYYFVSRAGDKRLTGFKYNYTYIAKVLKRIIDINNELNEQEKIKVVSISLAFDEDKKGFRDVIDTIQQAEQNGIFVISASLDKTYGYSIVGAERDINTNPDNIESYTLADGQVVSGDKLILAPMNSRTVASATGDNEYVFFRKGGISWCIPYLAGVYALTMQIDDTITPEEFLISLLETGDKLDPNDGKNAILINPIKLIEAISNNP